MQVFNNSIKINIAFIIIIIFLCFFINSNDYALQNIDKLAYVVALGIDVGNNNNINLSIQIAKPSSISSSSSSSSSEQSSASVVNSLECSSIQEGMNLFNSYISRNINLSHCKVIIISEELAARDISSYLLDLSNNVEVSTHANILISKSKASSLLEMTKPTLENFPARYYDILNTASISTAYTQGTTLMDFFSTYNSTFQEPVSVLSNINNSSTHTEFSSESYINKDNSYIAGETPINSKNNIENMGLAVFKNGKLVGELNGLESICHMIVSGKLKYCNIQVENPKNMSENIDLKLQLRNKPNIKLKILNGFPYIEININIDSQIISANGKVNYQNDENIQILEYESNKYLEKIIYDYLYKISKSFNSDIDGFGRYASKYFLTINDFENYKWLDNFENSFFKVTVNTKIKSSTNFING